MMDTRFSTAMQMLIIVAQNEDVNVRSTSTGLAASLNTNASFIRKMLLQLGEAGIISSTAGNKGGVRLAKSRKRIKLDEIYQAVMAQSKLLENRFNTRPECAMSEKLAQYSEKLCFRVETAVIDMLRSLTLQDTLDELVAFKMRPRRVASEGK